MYTTGNLKITFAASIFLIKHSIDGSSRHGLSRHGQLRDGCKHDNLSLLIS
jgi:hypothetical protein